jgi:hypothetical protein
MDEVFEKPRQSLVRLFASYLGKLARMSRRAPAPFGTYYEFGTGWGGTLASFMLAAEQVAAARKMDPAAFRVYAFDSFEGLPPSDHPADRHSGWREGSFANSVEVIRAKMDTHPFAKRVPTTYIKGYYEESLTSGLIDELKPFPPAIITLDVDFYTSTKTVLSWIDQFVASGALIYFDDIWSYHGHPEFGQMRAIHEFGVEGNGYLVPFNTFGEAGKTFVYSRKTFEHV